MKLFTFKNWSISIIFLLICSCGGNGTKKFDINTFTPNSVFEFHEHSLSSECPDPSKRIVTVLDDTTASIYIWHKGCPNEKIYREKLIYNYRIDDASNWRLEWGGTDDKVIILENPNAGYYNGYMHLSKRYMISNSYSDGKLIEPRIFQQLDKREYPGRNEEFVTHGGLNEIRTIPQE